MSMTFSQFLLRHEYVSLAELEEASQATVLYGGRLGSAVIELGLLTARDLDRALARFHGLPEIPEEWLVRPDAGARAALHLDLIQRHRAFPLNFEKRSLHVGLMDPQDPAVLDNLAFASGCSVVPYALAEFRFVELMHRIYGVAPSSRFKSLLDEGARARAMRSREQQRQRPASEQGQLPDTGEIGPLAADLELSDRDAFVAASTAPLTPAPAATPSSTPGRADDAAHFGKAPVPSIEALERTIAKSEDRAEVIDSSVALAARFAEVAALFVIRDGVAAGLVAHRDGEPFEIEATLIPLAPESALSACSAARTPVRMAPRSKLDKLLAKALRSDEQSEVAVFPISIGERVVNLLVAQPTSGALGATAGAALAALAPQIGAAYERLIRVQKHRTRAAPAPARELPKRAAIGALPLQKRVVRVPASTKP